MRPLPEDRLALNPQERDYIIQEDIMSNSLALCPKIAPPLRAPFYRNQCHFCDTETYYCSLCQQQCKLLYHYNILREEGQIEVQFYNAKVEVKNLIGSIATCG